MAILCGFFWLECRTVRDYAGLTHANLTLRFGGLIDADFPYAEEAVRVATEDFLQQRGCVVLTADSGNEALITLRENACKPDAIAGTRNVPIVRNITYFVHSLVRTLYRADLHLT